MITIITTSISRASASLTGQGQDNEALIFQDRLMEMVKTFLQDLSKTFNFKSYWLFQPLKSMHQFLASVSWLPSSKHTSTIIHSIHSRVIHKSSWWNSELVNWWDGEMVNWWNSELVNWWIVELLTREIKPASITSGTNKWDGKREKDSGERERERRIWGEWVNDWASEWASE